MFNIPDSSKRHVSDYTSQPESIADTPINYQKHINQPQLSAYTSRHVISEINISQLSKSSGRVLRSPQPFLAASDYKVHFD